MIGHKNSPSLSANTIQEYYIDGTVQNQNRIITDLMHQSFTQKNFQSFNSDDFVKSNLSSSDSINLRAKSNESEESYSISLPRKKIFENLSNNESGYKPLLNEGLLNWYLRKKYHQT